MIFFYSVYQYMYLFCFHVWISVPYWTCQDLKKIHYIGFLLPLLRVFKEFKSSHQYCVPSSFTHLVILPPNLIHVLSQLLTLSSIYKSIIATDSAQYFTELYSLTEGQTVYYISLPNMWNS